MLSRLEDYFLIGHGSAVVINANPGLTHPNY